VLTQDLRSPDARDAADGRLPGATNVVFVPARPVAAAPSGFDWRSAAIGAAVDPGRPPGKHDHRITLWKLGGGDHPVFGPDGTILVRAYEEDASRQSDYRTVRADGSQLRQLTHFKPGTLVLSTSYSPDGEWIVHATNGVGGNADVFVMRADGTGNRPVTRTKLWDSAPDWSP
jgi:hypothetical protein